MTVMLVNHFSEDHYLIEASSKGIFFSSILLLKAYATNITFSTARIDITKKIKH